MFPNSRKCSTFLKETTVDIFDILFKIQMRSRSSFTLIELLVVIALIAILAVVVLLVLNPAELLRQGRDSTRVSDLAQLNQALNLYQGDGGSSFGTASTVYVSVPDSSATCANLGLPSLSSGYTYHCTVTSTYRNVDGTGWIPVNFSGISYGNPLGSLPIDPVNATSSLNYYTYISGGSWELTATMESLKYIQSLTINGGPNPGLYPGLYQAGSNPNISLPYLYGLVGYWKFDEATGTSAADSSGAGNTATLTNSPLTWTAAGSCKAGGCLQLNSSGNGGAYVSIADASSLRLSQYTVGGWFQFTNNAGNHVDRIISKNGVGINANYYMWHGSTNIYFGYGDGSVDRGTADVMSPAAGQWYHLISTYDGQNEKLYVNGALAITQSSTSTPASSNSAAVELGCAQGEEASCKFQGYMDEIRIYNRALSAGEISVIYNATR